MYHQKTKAQHKIIDEGNFTYRVILSIINKYLKGTKKVLDIGCGAGTLDFYLANKGHNVTGIDISEKAIEAKTMYIIKKEGLKQWNWILFPLIVFLMIFTLILIK